MSDQPHKGERLASHPVYEHERHDVKSTLTMPMLRVAKMETAAPRPVASMTWEHNR